MVVGEWHGLEVLYIALRVVVEDYAGVEQVFRVEKLLHLLHYLIGFLAPLLHHKWCHVASSAVLSLQ